MLPHGTLPRIHDSARPRRLLNAYVGEYLKEEVMAEGLVRNLPPFSEFLNSAALGDTEQVNFSNIARKLGVSRETVRGYYQILEDTLLPVYRKRPERRLSIAERFARFAFWRLSTGIEVDFIVNDLECAIECKSSERVRDQLLKGLRELKKEHSACQRRILVSREAASRKTGDGIEILSVKDFHEELWGGRLF